MSEYAGRTLYLVSLHEQMILILQHVLDSILCSTFDCLQTSRGWHLYVYSKRTHIRDHTFFIVIKQLKGLYHLEIALDSRCI